MALLHVPMFLILETMVCRDLVAKYMLWILLANLINTIHVSFEDGAHITLRQ